LTKIYIFDQVGVLPNDVDDEEEALDEEVNSKPYTLNPTP